MKQAALGGRKVCVIGLHKTGTKSVARALTALGLSVGNATGPLARALDRGPADPGAVIRRIALDVLANNDAAEDSPFAFLAEAVDAAFPGTRFILTTRDEDAWLDSYRRFFPDRNNPLRRWMYGVDGLAGNEARYREVWRDRHAAIRAHFRRRPGDLMEMNLEAGDGWAKLVGFLAPDHLPPFPHLNRST